jgi:uncharacterized delta-60 repeat protein
MAALVVLAAVLVLIAAPAQAAPGDLDRSFSGDGLQVTDLGGDDQATSVAIQADGRIVAAGRLDGDIALARYHADGSLDRTQTTDLGGSDAALAVAVGPDGGIVVAGWSDFDIALARYRADGSLDWARTTDLGGWDGATGLALHPDGGIVVAGWSDSDFAVARYHPAGALDWARTTGGGGHSQAAAVAIGADGRIVVAGGHRADFMLARYHPDGTLDPTFAGGGVQRTDLGGGETAHSVAIQPDGRIVAAGSIGGATVDWTDFALARYHADGSLDASFGSGGVQTTDLHLQDAVHDIAIQADGRIVAAGTAAPDFMIARGDFGLARYTPDGQLDATFAGDGRQFTDFSLGGEDSDDAAGGVAIQADGRIVVAGGATGGYPGDFALARYEAGAAGAPPANASPPAISGTAAEGRTLTVVPGMWSGPVSLAHRWRRCDASGGGCADVASGGSYTLTAADVGRTLRVRETASNPYGTATADSGATAVVQARPGAIAGTVRSSKRNAAIAGATVTCAGRSATTAGNGTFSIAGVAPGTHRCTASASRHAPSSRTLTVVSGQTTTANFTLTRR